MAKRKAPTTRRKKPATTYTVRSANTGAHVCGPYAQLEDAERECGRLNDEARTGIRKAPSRRNGRDGGEVINYQDRMRCRNCGGQALRRGETVACGRCKSTELEVAERIPRAILHDGQPQGYEIVTDAGLVVA